MLLVFWGLLCVFFLLVCLFPPKAIKSRNPLLLQTDDRNEKQRQKKDLQDSMHCCGSNPRSMLMNCTCDNQHLSHAIITLTKPRSIYLWWKNLQSKKCLHALGSRNSGSRVFVYYRTTRSQHLNLWLRITTEERSTVGGKNRHNCKVTKQIISYVHRG